MNKTFRYALKQTIPILLAFLANDPGKEQLFEWYREIANYLGNYYLRLLRDE